MLRTALIFIIQSETNVGSKQTTEIVESKLDSFKKLEEF